MASVDVKCHKLFGGFCAIACAEIFRDILNAFENGAFFFGGLIHSLRKGQRCGDGRRLCWADSLCAGEFLRRKFSQCSNAIFVLIEDVLRYLDGGAPPSAYANKDGEEFRCGKLVCTVTNKALTGLFFNRSVF